MSPNISPNSTDNLWYKRLYIRIKNMTSRQCLLVLSAIVLILSVSTIVLSHKFDTNLSTKLKLIVDVDVGTDDAMALFILLRAEKYAKLENNPNGPEILGITCVNGNTGLGNVVINTLKVLQLVDRLDIPVYIGAEKSLLKTPRVDDYFGLDGMGDIPMIDPPSVELAQSEHAVHALIRLVNENPGEITILTLGPLTNIALAIRLDPNFLKKIKKLIILGGSIEGKGNMIPGVEFNFYMDAEANYVVLNDTKINEHSVLLVPWEAVLNVEVPMEWRINTLGSLNSPEMIFMNKIEHIENYEDEHWLFADPLAAIVTLNETLIGKIKSFGVTAITEGPTRGGLVVDYTDILKSTYKIDIAYDIHMQGYQDSLMHHFA